MTRREKIDLERYTNQTLFGITKAPGELHHDATRLIHEWCLIDWGSDQLVLLSSSNLPSDASWPDYLAVDYAALLKKQAVRPMRPAAARQVLEDTNEFTDVTERVRQRLIQAEQLAFAQKPVMAQDALPKSTPVSDNLINRLYYGTVEAGRVQRLYRLWQTNFG